KLTADGKILFQFESVKDYRSRVRQLFPKSFSELILFEEAGAPLSVTGFLQQPVSSSRAENFQSIFVNQRPVQHRAIYRTILDALGNPQSRPNFILYIKSDPEFVDVNIHPAKTEIKFRDERYAQDFIFQAIKKNLKPTAERVISLREGYLEYPTGEEQEKGEEFWQLHNTYIIAQTKNGMIVVDQHVAHERIIFETILKNKPGIQRLLFPVIVELNAQEFETFKSIKDSLAEMGIEAKEFSANVIVIDTLPAGTKLNRDELKNLFVELSELKAELIKKREEVAKVIACKTAIKAGDRLTPAEMQNLIDRLFACENPYLCPHGRPTVIKFSLDDLAHRFGRT
ncbi:MAG: hypothetical protein ABIL05_02490, partial [candidate division WOR-3 bacterium]